jgi:hypothetical protein
LASAIVNGAKCHLGLDRMIGDIVSAHVVKARWAYGELTSTRFGLKYRGLVSRHIHDAAATGRPFSQLMPADIDELVTLLPRVREREFLDAVDAHPSYRCKALTRGQVAQLHVLPTFWPKGHVPTAYMPYMDFYFQTFGRGNVGPRSDPRVIAHGIDPSAPLGEQEPVIVIRVGRRHLLIEGYLRSVLFMRHPDRNLRLRAWLPISGAPSPAPPG